jgi:excisionase family DNA binding protein
MRLRQTRAINVETEKVLLTIEEAAELLSLGLSSVYTLVLTKQLPSIKVGRARRIPLVSLHQFVTRQLQEQR